MKRLLTVLAGRRAYSRIKREGLDPRKVRIIAGAAGGPKWLALSQLDRAIFGEWLKPTTQTIDLVGASIGAWRFSAVSQKDPLKAIRAFEEAYFNQVYSAKPTPEEVSKVSAEVLDGFVSEKGVEEILSHPQFRLHILTVTSHLLLASEKKAALLTGLGLALLGNAVHPKALEAFFRRAVFHDPRQKTDFVTEIFKSSFHSLTSENFKKAVLASGSIPGVMQPVTDFTELPNAVVRDGGVMDYHLALPYKDRGEDSFILFPHYTDKVVPNWFDKSLPWRKPSANDFKDVVLVAPSREFIATLPHRKIPDRNDFFLYRGENEKRLQYWNTVLTESERVREEFLNLSQTNRWSDVVQPF